MPMVVFCYLVLVVYVTANITKVPPTTVKDTHFTLIVARTTDNTIIYQNLY